MYRILTALIFATVLQSSPAVTAQLDALVATALPAREAADVDVVDSLDLLEAELATPAGRAALCSTDGLQALYVLSAEDADARPAEHQALVAKAADELCGGVEDPAEWSI